MLSTLLAAAALAVLDAETAMPERDLELAVRVTATRLVALNPTAHPELVRLVDPCSQRRADVLVPAGGTVDFSFPAGTLDGLEMTIFARDAQGLVASATWSLADLATTQGELLRFDAPDDHGHAWIETPRGFALLLERGEAPGRSAHGNCSPPAPLTSPHVPVITPYDGHKGDLPPRLERKLPPL
jgi:hypothetical protein